MNEYKMYYNVSITADAAKVHTGRPRLVRELCPNKHFETIFTLCSLQLVRFLKRSHSKLLNSAILISAIFLDTTHKNSGLFLQRHFSKICTN